MLQSRVLYPQPSNRLVWKTPIDFNRHSMYIKNAELCLLQKLSRGTPFNFKEEDEERSNENKMVPNVSLKSHSWFFLDTIQFPVKPTGWLQLRWSTDPLEEQNLTLVIQVKQILYLKSVHIYWRHSLWSKSMGSAQTGLHWSLWESAYFINLTYAQSVGSGLPCTIWRTGPWSQKSKRLLVFKYSWFILKDSNITYNMFDIIIFIIFAL